MLVIYDGKKKAIAYLKKLHRRNWESETYAQKWGLLMVHINGRRRRRRRESVA